MSGRGYLEEPRTYGAAAIVEDRRAVRKKVLAYRANTEHGVSTCPPVRSAYGTYIPSGCVLRSARSVVVVDMDIT